MVVEFVFKYGNFTSETTLEIFVLFPEEIICCGPILQIDVLVHTSVRPSMDVVGGTSVHMCGIGFIFATTV